MKIATIISLAGILIAISAWAQPVPGTPVSRGGTVVQGVPVDTSLKSRPLTTMPMSTKLAGLNMVLRLGGNDTGCGTGNRNCGMRVSDSGPTNITLELYNGAGERLVKLWRQIVDEDSWLTFKYTESDVRDCRFVGGVGTSCYYLSLFMPSDNDTRIHNGYAERSVFMPDVEVDHIKRADIILDDFCCGDYFDVQVDYLVLFNNLWYLIWGPWGNDDIGSCEVGDDRTERCTMFRQSDFSATDRRQVAWKKCSDMGSDRNFYLLRSLGVCASLWPAPPPAEVIPAR